MVSLVFVFYMFVTLFAVIGAMRGWAKELLVTFSVILSLAFSQLMEQYVPFVKDIAQRALDPNVILPTPDTRSLFWIRTVILIVLVFFGYQTVNLPRLSAKAIRERLQDLLLGFVLGGVNGYLVVGSLWFYMFQAHYPFDTILDPAGYPEYADAAAKMIAVLPPRLLGVPGIYFAVIIAFIFVIVVYI
ncbi:MAG: hypothetical protein GXP40_05125 [Chloroflexi bacterium]|nr:hypothetical protein [Chloroflexota bacterium]